MYKSRMHTVAMLMAVALTASVSVSAATAVEPTTAPAPAPTFTPESAETDESSMEMTDSFICPPEESVESDGELQHRPTRPPCR